MEIERDRLAFSQMILAALSHDFVTPFRTAINCCREITEFASRGEIYAPSDIQRIEAARIAIAKQLFPKLTSLYDEAKLYERDEPNRMIGMLVDRVGSEINARLADLRAVSVIADRLNPHGRLNQILDDLQTVTGKIAAMMDGMKSLVGEEGDAERAGYRVSIRGTAKSAAEIFKPLEPDLSVERLGDAELAINAWKMFSIFSNLIGNAIKYSKEGQDPTVEIRTGQPASTRLLADRFSAKIEHDRVSDKHYRVFVDALKQGGEWCEIQVTDFGIGIPEKRLWGVFKLFKQLKEEPEYKRRKDRDVQLSMLKAYDGLEARSLKAHMGIGLGLALTQYYARRDGGEIAVSSKSGGPTTFGIWLPVSDANSVKPVPLRHDVWWNG